MPTPLRPCPTPWKLAWSSAGEALAGFPVDEATRPHHPYRCCCGKYHMTTHPPLRHWRQALRVRCDDPATAKGNCPASVDGYCIGGTDGGWCHG